MSAESLVQIAEERGLIDTRTADKLRQQLAEKPDVAAEKVAKLLVKRDKITKAQAKVLLEQVAAADNGDDSSSNLGLAASDSSPVIASVQVPEPVASETEAPEDSHVGLASLDEPGEESGENSEREQDELLSSGGALRPLEVEELAPLDDEKLTPLDGGELTPLDDGELTPLDDEELVPLDEFGSSSLDGHGLTPLDGDGLIALDELTPLDDERTSRDDTSAGLTALEKETGAAHDPVDSGAGFTALPDSALEAEDGADATVMSRRKKGKGKGWLGGIFSRSTSPRIRKNRWDSPLLLLGGGGLVLLTLAALLLYYVLTRGTGDEYFSLAEEDYRSSAYTQAIYKYETYVAKFPKHPKVSLAKCKIGLSRMRQAVQSKDWERSLATADESLLEIKSEEAFPEVMPELQGILPEIYEGFVEPAKSTQAIADKEELLSKAKKSLGLVDNPEYLPTSHRKSLQARIDKIAKEVALIDREIYRDRELQSAIQRIRDAANAGQTAEAYGFRKELLSRYPELTTNAQLRDAVLAITVAEVARVEVQRSELLPTQSDVPPGPSRTVVMVDRRQNATAPLADDIIFINAQGAIYGLKGASGELLWRRWIGFQSQARPAPISADPGADALILDERSHDLLRLNANTGELVWRLPLGEASAQPLVLSGRALLALESGKLQVVDLATGAAERHLVFPQRLVGPPAIDASRGLIYQPGEHSSLYVCDATSLECQQVYYLGHRAGTIMVPPALANGFVFLAESGGTEFATLHVLQSDSEGQLLPVLDPLRLDGSVSQPMLTSGNRVIISTDLGAVYVFIADPTTSDQPVRMIARMLRTTGEPKTHFALVERSRIFIAADNLIQYELQASRGELVRKWVDTKEDVYVGPLQFRNNVLIHQKRTAGSYGTTISAVQIAGRSTGQQPPEAVWSVQLGMKPAGKPTPGKSGVIAIAISTDGVLWNIDRNSIAEGRLDKVVRPVASALKPPFAAAQFLSGDRVVLPTEDGQLGFLLYDQSASRPFRYVRLRISNPQLATLPVPYDDQNLLVCTSDGPVYIVDLNGNPSLLPFQPALVPNQSVEWLKPVVIDGAAVVANAAGDVHLLGTQAEPKPHLLATVSNQTKKRLTGPLSAMADTVFVVSREDETKPDRLLALSLTDLKPKETTDCSGQVVFGPYRAGNVVVVVLDNRQMIAFASDGKPKWQLQLFGDLAGPPLVLDGSLICATTDGSLFRLDAESGQSQAWDVNSDALDIGQPLGSGPSMLSGKFLMVLGRDSTLHVLKLPQGK